MSAEEAGWMWMPKGEPIPGKTYRADGWVYRDMDGKVSAEVWDKLLSVIGEGEYVVLIMSIARSEKGEWRRGQLLISPAGLTNMRAYSAREGSSHDGP